MEREEDTFVAVSYWSVFCELNCRPWEMTASRGPLSQYVSDEHWLLWHSPPSSCFPSHGKVVILAAYKKKYVSGPVWRKWVELNGQKVEGHQF